MSDPAYRAPVVRDVAESGVYLDPTLIIYKYILVYVSDDLFADLQSNERLAYLPKRTRDEYLNPETNEYWTGFARVFDESLGGQEAVVDHVLGETERRGTVEVGKRADFILVTDNPLADISNAADVSGVFSHGKWRSASHLANMLMEAKVLSVGAK